MVVITRHGLGWHNLSNRASRQGNWAEHLRLRTLINHNQYMSPLAPEGFAQARALRPHVQRLLRMPWVDEVFGYVSPQLRAVQTANELALPIPWDYDHRLRERYWGEMERLVQTSENYARIKALMHECEQVDPFKSPPGGESIKQHYDEFTEFLSDKDAQHPGGTLYLSSHGEKQRVASMVHEGHPVTDWAKFQFPVPNCLTIAYSRVNPYTNEITERFGWKLSFSPGTAPDWVWHKIQVLAQGR
jgi:broad specificity phosphatase PhoE